mgnify:CR=1 FL=1|jgi:hypothetical protein
MKPKIFLLLCFCLCSYFIVNEASSNGAKATQKPLSSPQSSVYVPTTFADDLRDINESIGALLYVVNKNEKNAANDSKISDVLFELNTSLLSMQKRFADKYNATKKPYFKSLSNMNAIMLLDFLNIYNGLKDPNAKDYSSLLVPVSDLYNRKKQMVAVLEGLKDTPADVAKRKALLQASGVLSGDLPTPLNSDQPGQGQSGSDGLTDTDSQDSPTDSTNGSLGAVQPDASGPPGPSGMNIGVD